MKTKVNMKSVLVKALQEPFTIQSDFAREAALRVAEAATRGLIATTRHDPDRPMVNPQFGRKWFITMQGLLELNTILSKEIA